MRGIKGNITQIYIFFNKKVFHSSYTKQMLMINVRIFTHLQLHLMAKVAENNCKF